MMNAVLIRADGSTDIGHGHIFRTLALATALQNFNWSITYVCRNLPGTPLRRIKDTGCSYNLLSSAISEAEDTTQTIDLARKHKAAWIIVDRYATGETSLLQIKEAGFRILAIDDICEHPFPVDILLNQNINADTLDYRTSSQTLKLFGPKFALVRERYALARSAKPKEVNTVKRILLFMGGGDSKDATGSMLCAIEGLDYSVSVDVVVGSAYHFLDELRKTARNSKHRIRIVQDIPDLVDLLTLADVFICAGGSVIWEACCLGVPSIVMPIADNQLEVAKRLSDLKAVIKGDNAETTATTELRFFLEHAFSEVERLTNVGKNAWRLVDGLGVSRVCKAMATRTNQEHE